MIVYCQIDLDALNPFAVSEGLQVSPIAASAALGVGAKVQQRRAFTVAQVAVFNDFRLMSYRECVTGVERFNWQLWNPAKRALESARCLLT